MPYYLIEGYTEVPTGVSFFKDHDPVSWQSLASKTNSYCVKHENFMISPTRSGYRLYYNSEDDWNRFVSERVTWSDWASKSAYYEANGIQYIGVYSGPVDTLDTKFSA